MFIDNIFLEFNNIDNIIQRYSKKHILLLKKYLNQKELKDYIFSEALIKSKNNFDWFIPLYKENMFQPENNSLNPIKLIGRKGFKMPLWSALRYLKIIAIKNNNKKNKEVEISLIKILNKVIQYNNIEKIDNSRTDLELLEIISNLPSKYIEKKHLEFIKRSLKTRWDNSLFTRVLCEKFIPKIIKEKEKNLTLHLLEIIFSFIEKKGSFYIKNQSNIKNYILKDFLKKNIKTLAFLCGKEASLIGIKNIEKILKKDRYEFDIHSIWTIKDDEKPRNRDSYEYQIVRFVRDIHELLDASIIREDISILFNKKHSIFERLAIHAISYHYKKLNDLFWQTYQNQNPLENYQLKPEIYELFKDNCTFFDQEQIEKIIDWINARDCKDETKEVKAYRKKEWLETLLKTKDSKVLEEYKKNNEINPKTVIYPGKVAWMETYWDKSVSPFTPEELLEKTNEQIFQILINFKEEKVLKAPTQEGLEDSLRKSITANPEKYTKNLKPFFKLPLTYHRVIFQGLNSAWRENKSFSWKNVFDYMLTVIDKENDNYRGFWEIKLKKEGNYDYQNSIITEIAHLIHEGTRNDDHAFDKLFLPIAKYILLLLVNKVRFAVDIKKDLHSRIINSVKYRVFSAMISYSLRYARTNLNITEEDRWEREIKEDFTNRLAKETPEFYFILGQYFLNIYYLDKKWIQKNINKIFYKEDNLLCNSSIIGFFAYTNKVYLEIYNLLKENNILLYALNCQFSENEINEKVIQFVCIAYIEDWEKLDDPHSLISKIITDKKEYQIAEVVRFIEMLREKLNDNNKRKQKIKPLWRKIFNIIIENEDKPEFQNIATKLVDWLNLIDEIDDEIFIWLKLSVKYIDQYNPDWIYRQYYKHIDKNPEKIGKLILEMLKYKIPATYEIDYIKKTVEKLYDGNQKIIADEICNIYGNNGYYFLKDTFNNYNIN